MRSAVKQQRDDELFELWSDESALVFPVEEDRARQEFGKDADINVMLKRFGISGFAPRGVAQWGQEIDYDLDLQQALDGVAAAQAAHRKMSAELRERFPTWQSLLNALVSGEFKLELNKEPEPEVEEPVPEAPPPGG